MTELLNNEEIRTDATDESVFVNELPARVEHAWLPAIVEIINYLRGNRANAVRVENGLIVSGGYASVSDDN